MKEVYRAINSVEVLRKGYTLQERHAATWFLAMSILKREPRIERVCGYPLIPFDDLIDVYRKIRGGLDFVLDRDEIVRSIEVVHKIQVGGVKVPPLLIGEGPTIRDVQNVKPRTLSEIRAEIAVGRVRIKSPQKTFYTRAQAVWQETTTLSDLDVAERFYDRVERLTDTLRAHTLAGLSRSDMDEEIKRAQEIVPLLLAD